MSSWWQSLKLRGAVEKEECKGLQHVCKHEKALHINNIKI